MKALGRNLLIVLSCLVVAGAYADRKPPKSADKPTARSTRKRTPPQPKPKQPVAPAKRPPEPRKPGADEKLQPAPQPEPERAPRNEPKPVLPRRGANELGGTARDDDHPRVVMEIGHAGDSWGEILIELYPEQAPKTVANFLRYVEDGYYDDTVFHRVIPDFIVQGGGYDRRMHEKSDALHAAIPNESKTCGLKNEQGTLAMARGRDPHSARAQFFINLADTPALDPGNPRGDEWGYCVFGRVVSGFDIVRRIAKERTRRNPRVSADSTPTQPLRPPEIVEIYLLGAGTASPQDVPPPPPELMPPPDDTPPPQDESEYDPSQDDDPDDEPLDPEVEEVPED
jgi:peptidyl-prolyl cis-trans isomerase B (cyclophilin B)